MAQHALRMHLQRLRGLAQCGGGAMHMAPQVGPVRDLGLPLAQRALMGLGHAAQQQGRELGDGLGLCHRLHQVHGIALVRHGAGGAAARRLGDLAHLVLRHQRPVPGQLGQAAAAHSRFHGQAHPVVALRMPAAAAGRQAQAPGQCLLHLGTVASQHGAIAHGAAQLHAQRSGGKPFKLFDAAAHGGSRLRALESEAGDLRGLQ